MKKEKTKALREGAMMVALTVLLMLLTKYMPLFSVIGAFVCGIPMAALTARNGLKAAIPAVFSVFLMAVFIDGAIVSAVSTVLMSVAPGAAAGYALGKRKPFFVSLFATSLTVCIGWLFELLMLKLLMGGTEKILADLMVQLKASISPAIEMMGDMISESFGMKPEAFADTFLETVSFTLQLYLPSMIIVSSMVTGYIILRLSGSVIRRTKVAAAADIRFSELKAPRSLGTVAVIIYLVYMFSTYGSAVWSVCANLVFVLYTILGVCGLSFIDFKLKKHIRPAVVRFIIYLAAAMLLGVFANLLIIIGILDSGRDFRGLDAAKQNDSNEGGTL